MSRESWMVGVRWTPLISVLYNVAEYFSLQSIL